MECPKGYDKETISTVEEIEGCAECENYSHLFGMCSLNY